jgi:hemerythrin-like metal-binding protein
MNATNNALFGQAPTNHLSLAKLIQFGDHLFVEHPALDVQHKAIFKLGIGVHENWRSGKSADVLPPAPKQLTNLMHSHFTYEERVLGEIGYEDLKDHATEHRLMRDELSDIHDRFPSLNMNSTIR